jgi:hypothetical protein
MTQASFKLKTSRSYRSMFITVFVFESLSETLVDDRLSVVMIHQTLAKLEIF